MAKSKELDMIEWEDVGFLRTPRIPNDEIWTANTGLVLGINFKAWDGKTVIVKISRTKEYVKIRLAKPNEKGFALTKKSYCINSNILKKTFKHPSKFKIVERKEDYIVAKLIK